MSEGNIIYRAPDQVEHAEMIYNLLTMHFGHGSGLSQWTDCS